MMLKPTELSDVLAGDGASKLTVIAGGAVVVTVAGLPAPDVVKYCSLPGEPP